MLRVEIGALACVGLTFEQDCIGYVEPTAQLKSFQEGDDAMKELLADLKQKVAETGAVPFSCARSVRTRASIDN